MISHFGDCDRCHPPRNTQIEEKLIFSGYLRFGFSLWPLFGIAPVFTFLLSNRVERGLETSKSYLFVIDGSKALRRAIRDVFGKRALVQRCQVHKRRDVLSHLPKSMHKRIGKQISDAYRLHLFSQAQSRLSRLANRLEKEYPSAASSPREGLDETLTVKRMHLAPVLQRSLSSTNQIENLNGSIRRINRRVKRRRGGSMTLR